MHHIQSNSVCFESLERRQMLSVSLGTNLLANGDAETDTGAADSTTVVNPSGWNVGSSTSLTPGFTVVKYGASGGFPGTNTPGPSDRGNNFFAGGPDEQQDDAIQVIDLSSIAADIDAGRISANLSGWLGGFSSEADSMELTMNFSPSQDPSSNAPISAGEVTASDRNNVTEFLQVSKTKLIPVGTRSVTIALTATLATPSYNDGYADDISFKLSSSATKGFISGRVINDGEGTNDMPSEVGGVSVFIDSNKNGKFDKGELSAKTHSNGRYTFANMSKGTYSVVELVPASFRAITASTTSVTVKSGLTTAQNFTVSQTALLGGQALADFNNNGKFDSDDLPDDGVLIYLDTNNNGQFDSFELHTLTTPKGNWRFTVPFGTYIIRELIQGESGPILPAKAVPLTLTKGQVSIKNNFLNPAVRML
jgi:hypothetical protein